MEGFEISMQWTAGLHASRMLSGEYPRTVRKHELPGRCSSSLPTTAGRRKTPTHDSPRLTFTNKQHYLEDSDLWLMDGSYLRLKVP